MREQDHPITVLVTAASEGNADAWREIVERYGLLLVGVIRRYRLTPSEIEDVAQTVWLRLVEHLDALREPRALPTWIVTTAQREALRTATGRHRAAPRDPQDPVLAAEESAEPAPDADLLHLERQEALLAGLAELPTRQRDLLLMLMADPVPTYAEIHRRTGIPIGSIGPTRGRALARLRATAPVRAFLAGADATTRGGGVRG